MTKLENPNVPTLFLTSRGINTPYILEYNDNLFDLKKKNQFGTATIVNGTGDETVPTYSALLPAFKWAWEFQHKKQDAKPVKIVDYCSSFNEKYNPFDETESGSEFKINKNEFLGIQCDCMTSNKFQPCYHAAIINDSYVIKFTLNSLQDNQISYSEAYESYVRNLDDQYLDTITNECPQVKF